ncbi:MAG: diguanylate cyclase [Candidatus Adiutrix sp.]|jgi:diguanylate cyclase (GGDEF)-like protein|nr:diguanylate cyclase [Candidatus Adiutrix sp.]
MSENKPQPDSDLQSSPEPLDRIAAYLQTLLIKHENPELPPEVETVEGLQAVAHILTTLKEVLFYFSIGDFDRQFKAPGSTCAYLKTLQSNIRHLAWQCRRVAEGDLSQRVDFMGELSTAFNLMIQSLAHSRADIEKKQRELTKLTLDLKNEVKKKEQMETALRASEEMYRQRALRDPLTGLYNRSYFFESAAREMENLKRQKDGAACVMMIDIDFFKNFNDTHGHLVGDQAIKMVSGSIERILRRSDIFSRYGGEEFAIFLAGTDLEKGRTTAERIRLTVASQPNPARDDPKPITISIGVCGVTGESLNPLTPGHKILMEALAAADAALYTAKAKGRNLVWVADSPFSGPI